MVWGPMQGLSRGKIRLYRWLQGVVGNSCGDAKKSGHHPGGPGKEPGNDTIVGKQDGTGIIAAGRDSTPRDVRRAGYDLG